MPVDIKMLVCLTSPNILGRIYLVVEKKKGQFQTQRREQSAHAEFLADSMLNTDLKVHTIA